MELSVKPEKINTIFQMIKLSNKGELGLCAYNGVFFVKIVSNKNRLELDILHESYLTDKSVQKGVEYEKNKLLVCV